MRMAGRGGNQRTRMTLVPSVTCTREPDGMASVAAHTRHETFLDAFANTFCSFPHAHFNLRNLLISIHL